MTMEASAEELETLFSTVMPHLNELQRRVVAGAVARGLGRGGKTAVAEASGLSRNTVTKAQREVEAGIAPTEQLRVGATDRQSTSSRGSPRRSTSSCIPRPADTRCRRSDGP